MSNLTATRKNIEKIARLVADKNGLHDYNIVVIITPSQTIKSRPSYDKICQVVCDYMNVDKDVVFMHHRVQPYCLARQIIWYLAFTVWEYECTGLASFSGWDHSTVLHGVKVVRIQTEVDSKFAKQIEQLIELLNQ